MKQSFTAILFAVLAFVSFQAQAEFQPDLFPDTLVQKEIEGLKSFSEDVGNGDSSFDHYDVKTFNYTATLKDLIRKYNDNLDANYDWVPELKWQEVLSRSEYLPSDMIQNLKALIRHKAVKAIYGFYPNEDLCTEPEYCSIYYLYIYLNNGEVIYYEFNFTT